MKVVVAVSLLFWGSLAAAETMTIQSMAQFTLDGDVKVTESQARGRLKDSFKKDLVVFCAQVEARPVLKKFEILSYSRTTLRNCPQSENGAWSCDEEKKVASTYVDAMLSAKVECRHAPGAKAAVKLRAEPDLRIQQALVHRTSGRYVMNIAHSTGCGKHYLFVHRPVSCDEVKVPKHQELQISSTNSCSKIELYTDNSCEAGTSTTIELDNLSREDAEPWGRKILINSEAAPILIEDMGVLDVLSPVPPAESVAL